MGFLEDKQKVTAYDAMKNSADMQNAKVAQQVEAMNAAQLVKEQQARDAHMVNQGLAMASHGINPMGFSNVPDASIPGYTMPASEPNGVTGQEALAKQSNGGLANTLSQNSYQGVR